MAHILIVDDDADFQSAVCSVPELRRHDLVVAGSAEQALELLEQKSFDLLIVDLMLPGMDGAELIRIVRAQPATADVPVMVLTAAGRKLGVKFTESDRTWLPADVVLDKASDCASRIVSSVEELLGRSGAQEPAASRGWTGERLRHVLTTCPHCATGCGLYLKVRGNRLAGTAPSPSHPVSGGRLCVKGWTAYEAIVHAERLRHPLIRKEGKLVLAGWDEALDLCASRFRQVREQYGGESLGVLASAAATNEEAYLIQKFARAALGTNNVDHCDRSAYWPVAAALATSFGSVAMTNPIEEISRAACLLVIGSDATSTHPVVGWRVRQAKDAKATLIVADARRTDVAGWADIHLQHLPGTEAALLSGMANVIVSEGLHDRRFVGEGTAGFEELSDAVAKYTPEAVGEICGLEPDLVRESARIYALTRPASILFASQAASPSLMTDVARGAANLALLTGNLGKASAGVYPLYGQGNELGVCDMGLLPDHYPGYQPVGDPKAGKRFEQAWGVRLPARPGLGADEMVDAAVQGSLRALYVIGEGAALSGGNGALADRMRGGPGFVVCQDVFMNETCRAADVVLPAVSFAEKDGTFTSAERRVQRVRQAIDPLPGCRADWQIICELSQRMGYAMAYAGPAEVFDEAASLVPAYGGITRERIDRVGLQWPCPHADHPGTPMLHQKGFACGKGRFYAPEHSVAQETPDDEYPLVLMTGGSLFDRSSGVLGLRSETLSRECEGNRCIIHPADAARYEIAAGGLVEVATRLGVQSAAAEVTDRIRRGVIWMASALDDGPAGADLCRRPRQRGRCDVRAARVRPVAVAAKGA